MCESPPLESVVLNVLGPDRALQVHQHAGLWLVQLDHHDGTEVASLVPVGVEVAREASEGSVGDGADVLHVGVVLPVTVEPGHVHPGAGLALPLVIKPIAVEIHVAAVWIILWSALVLPDLRNVFLQLDGHAGAGIDLLHRVRHRLPVVDLVHLQ